MISKTYDLLECDVRGIATPRTIPTTINNPITTDALIISFFL